MKKINVAFIILIVAICLSNTAFSESVKGHIYSTDILAFVNGKPIESYNIGGRTVIIAEALDDYGFTHEYDDSERVLKVKSYFNKGTDRKVNIERGKVGEILGNVYKTDIKVYYNGILVDGYNIGGRTCICIEDLGDLTDSPNGEYGYSEYLGKSVWNPIERTISYESYIQNKDEILGISRVYNSFMDNVIYTHSDDFCSKSEFVYDTPYSPGTGASKYLIKPLYFDNHGEQIRIGMCVVNPNNTTDEPLMYIENPQQVREMIKSFKTQQKSYDEAMEYFKSICTDIEKIDSDKYTVLKAVHQTEGLIFVYIKKTGGFVVENFYNGYADREIKFWFDEEDVNSGPYTVIHSVYPFGGPHGTTTAHFSSDLDEFDYE